MNRKAELRQIIQKFMLRSTSPRAQLALEQDIVAWHKSEVDRLVIEGQQGRISTPSEAKQPDTSKPITSPWLEGAHYSFNPVAILPYLDVYVPNSATDKEYRYRGKKQCGLVQCLLDELKIPGVTEYAKKGVTT